MKFSLPNRVSLEYFKKADEIKVSWADRNKMIDYIEQYPEKTYILAVGELNGETDLILAYAEKLGGNFHCEVSNVNDLKHLIDLGVQAFWAYPIQTWEEFLYFKKLGVSYVRPGAPLFFELNKVKSHGIPVRITPNAANYYSSNSACSTWVRPEDVDYYSEYIDAFEFDWNSIVEAEALYRIYAEKKEWIDRIDKLIKHCDIKEFSSLFPKDFAEIRSHCRQRCMEGRDCKYCLEAVRLAGNAQKMIEMEIGKNGK